MLAVFVYTRVNFFVSEQCKGDFIKLKLEINVYVYCIEPVEQV